MRKPDTKGHIAHDSIYMKCLEQSHSETEGRMMNARNVKTGELGECDQHGSMDNV